MTETSKSERSVALSLREMWRLGTLAPLFSDWMVLVVLGAVTVALVVLTAVRGTGLANLVTWIGAIYAFCWGVYTYGDKKEQSNKEPFLKEQLRLCFRASELAATLASETCGKKWEEARKEFWQLYWGSLCIVEGTAVEEAMVHFGSFVPPATTTATDLKLPMNSLCLPSYRLAKELRALVLKSWNVQALGDLLDKRESELVSQDKARQAADNKTESKVSA